MLKHSEQRYGNYKVMMASLKFDVRSSSPFSRNSLRPENLENEREKI